MTEPTFSFAFVDHKMNHINKLSRNLPSVQSGKLFISFLFASLFFDDFFKHEKRNLNENLYLILNTTLVSCPDLK